MKKGTIIRNHWAGDNNPMRYFIYTGSSGSCVNGIALVSRQLRKAQYYKTDFNNRDIFEIVGQSKGFDILENDLKSCLEEE